VAVTIPPLPRTSEFGRDTARRAAARQHLASVLWKGEGERLLPREKELLAALEACDPRDVWWVCEASSAGPVYLLPTREWLTALVRFLERRGVTRVLEVAAGDGFLSACVARARPSWQVHATDSHAWKRPSARQSPGDKKRYRGVPFAGLRPGANVERLPAVKAVERHRPDVVLVSWAPPGLLVERVIRAPSKLVLDIGAEGDVCGNGTRTWRYFKEFVDGPVESRALCRLDARPSRERKTRVTLYYGRAHPEHGVDRGALF
jgi:hypothetical protein